MSQRYCAVCNRTMSCMELFSGIVYLIVSDVTLCFVLSVYSIAVIPQPSYCNKSYCNRPIVHFRATVSASK